jgi:predicted anti-sigma-YlaC factor YlaD
VALHQPEVRESLEKVINNHLDLCAECREWKAGNVNADWRRWIADR